MWLCSERAPYSILPHTWHVTVSRSDLDNRTSLLRTASFLPHTWHVLSRSQGQVSACHTAAVMYAVTIHIHIYTCTSPCTCTTYMYVHVHVHSMVKMSACSQLVCIANRLRSCVSNSYWSKYSQIFVHEHVPLKRRLTVGHVITVGVRTLVRGAAADAGADDDVIRLSRVLAQRRTVGERLVTAVLSAHQRRLLACNRLQAHSVVSISRVTNQHTPYLMNKKLK